MTIDNVSPPGAWQREWDMKPHTEMELRQEIRELRDRIRSYVLELEKKDEVIESLTEELGLIDKFWRKEFHNE